MHNHNNLSGHVRSSATAGLMQRVIAPMFGKGQESNPNERQ
jgi:hypothetical protein